MIILRVKADGLVGGFEGSRDKARQVASQCRTLYRKKGKATWLRGVGACHLIYGKSRQRRSTLLTCSVDFSIS